MCQCVLRCPRKDRRQLVSVESVLVKKLLVKLGLSAHFAASYHTPTPSAVLFFSFIFNQILVSYWHRLFPVVPLWLLCTAACCAKGCVWALAMQVFQAFARSTHRWRCQCQLRLRLGIQMKICCSAPASAHTNQQRARMASVGFSMRRMANFAALALFLLHMTLVASQNPFRISSLSPNSVASSGGMFISVHAANGGLLSR
jgi:hypothetical protein